MKKNMLNVGILIIILFSTAGLSAKCYSFRKADGVKVCINGDSNADRRKALSICMNLTGLDCGGVGGYTDSCHKSKKIKCYNEDAKELNSISVD